MRLNHYDAALVYRQLSDVGNDRRLDRLRALNQADRKVLECSLKSLSQGRSESGLSDIDISPVIRKLSGECTLSAKPYFLTRLFRVIASWLHLRLSSKQILQLWKRLQEKQQKLVQLSLKQASKEEQLQGIEALIAFKQTRARYEYNALKDLYENLSEDLDDAKLTVEEAKAAHQEIVHDLKRHYAENSTTVDIDYIYVHEKQVLPSLERLASIDISNEAGQQLFKKRLQEEIKACILAIDQCDNPTFEQMIIHQIRSEIELLNRDLGAHQQSLEPIRKFELLHENYRDLVLRLSSLPNSLLQHNTLGYLEEQVTADRTLSLRSPLEDMDVDDDGARVLFAWELEAKEVRKILWETHERQSRGFELRNFAEGNARREFCSQCYEKELGLSFCHENLTERKIHYTSHLRELHTRLPEELLAQMRRHHIDPTSLFVVLLPEQPSDFEAKDYYRALSDSLQGIDDPEFVRALLGFTARELKMAHEKKLEDEKKDKLALNLMGLGKDLETGDFHGLEWKTWKPQVELVQELRDRGIISYTHFKVVCQMFSYAMAQLQKELPRFPMRNENELIALGIMDSNSLYSFLNEHKMELSKELLELFSSVLSRQI